MKSGVKALAFVAALVACRVARADDPKPAPATAAWAAGVSDEEQATALAIYKEGNAEFELARYQQALVKYREALKHWDHPAIHFNMVVCLVNLDDPVQAFEHLELALRYGEPALGHDVYVQALTSKKMLTGMIAKLEVTSHEPQGASVTLDGRKLFTAPGQTTELVTPGDHQIVATKEGFITQTITLTLVPGKVTVRDVKLLDVKSAARIEHRWKAWIPWTVFGGGFAVAGIGGLLRLKATSDNAAWTRHVTDVCLQPCSDSALEAMPEHSLATSAHVENGFAIGAITVGATAIVVGSVMLYANRGRTVYDLGESPTRSARIDLAPTRDGAVLTVSGRF